MSDYIGEASVKITGDIKPLEQAVNQAKQLAGQVNKSFKDVENLKINIDGKTLTNEQYKLEQQINAMDIAVQKYGESLGVTNKQLEQEARWAAEAAEKVARLKEEQLEAERLLSGGITTIASTMTMKQLPSQMSLVIGSAKEFGQKVPDSFNKTKEAIENAGRVGRTALIALGAAMTALAKDSLKEYAKYSQEASDRQEELEKNISRLKAGFGSVLQPISEAVSGLAEWASQNQELVNGVLAFATVLGGSVGLIALVTKLKTALQGLGIATGGVIGVLSLIAGIFAIAATNAQSYDRTLEDIAKETVDIDKETKELKKAQKEYNEALADTNERITEAQKGISEARESYLDGLKKILDSHEKTVDTLTQQIKDANTDYQRAVGERNAEFAKSQAKEEKAHQEKVDELMAQVRFLQKYNDKYNKEKLEAVQFALRREEVLYQKQTEAEQRELDLRNAKEKEKLDKRLAEYQKELDEETAFLEKHRDDLNAVRERILLDEKEYLDKQYNQQVANYNRQIVNAKQKGKEAAEEYTNAYSKYIQSVSPEKVEFNTAEGTVVSRVIKDEKGNNIRIYSIGEKYSNGGYTGAGGKNEVAGIVHKGEYVLPQEMVDQTTGTPKAMGNITINISGTFATSDAEKRKVAQQIVAALQQTNYARLGA